VHVAFHLNSSLRVLANFMARMASGLKWMPIFSFCNNATDGISESFDFTSHDLVAFYPVKDLRANLVKYPCFS
jgi:hypothetical protein